MTTTEVRLHEELSKEYDANVVIVEDQEDIQNWLTSKSYACWASGSVITDGWVELATFSPGYKGGRQTIYICSQDKI